MPVLLQFQEPIHLGEPNSRKVTTMKMQHRMTSVVLTLALLFSTACSTSMPQADTKPPTLEDFLSRFNTPVTADELRPVLEDLRYRIRRVADLVEHAPLTYEPDRMIVEDSFLPSYRRTILWIDHLQASEENISGYGLFAVYTHLKFSGDLKLTSPSDHLRLNLIRLSFDDLTARLKFFPLLDKQLDYERNELRRLKVTCTP